MTLIKIPFMFRFQEPMKSGKKTMTARTIKKGEVGDEFLAFGCKFRLTNVKRVRLYFVRNNWEREGLDSPEAFEAVWRRLHPGRGYRANDLVWLHEFEAAGGRA